MKVVGDATRCMAAGFCEQVAPGVFRLDPDSGHVIVLVDEVPAEEHENVREAEGLCPNIALRVLDE